MTTAAEDVWYDAEAGPLVRLYAITGGRTDSPAGDFTLGAIVQRVPRAVPDGELTHEQSAIVRLAERPVSVSEIAARLGLPLGTVRVILGDLREAGIIAVPRSRGAADAPTMQQLQRLLGGLNSL
jgi:predicted Rossmann fold nucleotide-binding protein DprA/Smf involved in DNA uptake